MNTHRLLAIATTLCGDMARRVIFEPLVADWDREWRDTRGSGARRVILVKGAGAYTWSLVRCTSLAHIVAAAPSAGFALTLGLFAAVAALVQTQVVTYTWTSTHWDFASLQLLWFPWGDMEFLWLVPRWFAAGLVMAVLPAAWLAAIAGWRARRIVLGCAVAAALAIGIDAWLAPASEQVRRDRFFASIGRTGHALSGNTRAEDLTRHAVVVLSIAGLGLLGAALGRARAAARIETRFYSIALWWGIAWLSYSVLRYWSVELSKALGAQVAFSIWLPPLAFLAIACAAYWMANRAADVPHCEMDAPGGNLSRNG